MVINGKEINRGLVIASPYIDWILDGHKCWEMRSQATLFRGEFALIKKGSGLIVGIATLDDCLPPIKTKDLPSFVDKHRVDYSKDVKLAAWCVPWVLGDVQKINPVPYNHPRGAVKWVKL